MGRPLDHIASKLEYPPLLEDCRAVLQDLSGWKRPVDTNTGKHYIMRLFPYRTVDDVIEGVVLTFLDVTELQNTQAELSRHKDHLEELVEERTRALRDREEDLRRSEASARQRLIELEAIYDSAPVGPLRLRP